MKKLVYYTLVVIIIINIINITNNNEIIPNESIRMRVIPNSNNTEDIYIKNKVKEYLEKDVLNMIVIIVSIGFQLLMGIVLNKIN